MHLCKFKTFKFSLILTIQQRKHNYLLSLMIIKFFYTCGAPPGVCLQLTTETRRNGSFHFRQSPDCGSNRLVVLRPKPTPAVSQILLRGSPVTVAFIVIGLLVQISKSGVHLLFMERQETKFCWTLVLNKQKLTWQKCHKSSVGLIGLSVALLRKALDKLDFELMKAFCEKERSAQWFQFVVRGAWTCQHTRTSSANQPETSYLQMKCSLKLSCSQTQRKRQCNSFLLFWRQVGVRRAAWDLSTNLKAEASELLCNVALGNFWEKERRPSTAIPAELHNSPEHSCQRPNASVTTIWRVFHYSMTLSMTLSSLFHNNLSKNLCNTTHRRVGHNVVILTF